MVSWWCCCSTSHDEDPVPVRTDIEILHDLLHRLQDTQDVQTVSDTINFFAVMKLDVMIDLMHRYLITEKQSSSLHRITLYNILFDHIQQTPAYDLSEANAITVIDMAYEDMRQDMDLVNDYQKVARNILIFLERRFPEHVFTILLNSFQPEILPHANVLLTIANLSTDNDVSRISYQYEIMGKLTRVIHLVSEDCAKITVCQVILKFSFGAQKYFKAARMTAETMVISEDSTAYDMYEAFEVLFYSWLENTNVEGKRMILKTVGVISFLIPLSTFEEHFPCIMQGLIRQYTCNIDPAIICQCINKVLNVVTVNGTRTLACKSWPLILQQFSRASQHADDAPLKTIIRSLIRKNFQILAMYLMGTALKVFSRAPESIEESECIAAINILQDVISHDIIDVECHESQIMDAVMIIMKTQSAQVTEGPLGLLISTMACHGFMEEDRGWLLTEYIVRHCVCSTGSPSTTTTEKNKGTLQIACLVSLQYFGTMYTGNTSVLWVQLLSYVCSPAYSNALIPVCTSLTNLTIRLKADGLANFLVDINTTADLPSPQALLTRILTISSSLEAEGRLANAALSLLQAMCPLIHHDIWPVWDEEIPKMKANSDVTESVWESQLLEFIIKTMKTIMSEKWSNIMIQETKFQLITSTECPLEKAFLHKLLGAVIQAVPSEAFVKEQLSLILQAAEHEEEVELEAIACGIGLVSKEHLENTLSAVIDFGKIESSRTSSLEAKLMQGPWKSDNTWRNKACICMLALGHISKQAKRDEVMDKAGGMLETMMMHYSSAPEDTSVKLSFVKSVAMLTSVTADSGHGSLEGAQRKNVIKLMKDFINKEPLGSPVVHHALSAIINLSSKADDAVRGSTDKQLFWKGIFGRKH